MANIMKRGKSWQYRVSYIDKDGKRKYVSKSGFKTKRSAENASLEIETKYAHGATLDNSTITFMDYWDRWIELFKAGKHAEITEKRYTIIRGQLMKYFGPLRELKTITKSDWQEFINDFSTGKDRRIPKRRSKDTISKLNGYVRSMVNNAIDDQIVYSNFTNGVSIPDDQTESKIKYLELNDFKKLINTTTEFANYSEHFPYYLIATGALTGARYSEILGLTWKDVDFKNKQININKTWDYQFRSGFTKTKNKSSVRIIDVSDNLLIALHRLKKEQSEVYLYQGYRDKYNLVFRNARHEVPSNSSINRSLKALEKELGISDPITFHGLRHTHVSFLIYKHININYISRRLGHSNVTMTQNVYTHLLKSLEDTEVKATVDALSAL
ncbi:site-specific integrase [Lapidilactobacillus wuchangensis]|uniref:site-specific integrase n=1 Tax=Lapidilactobacillus wuchangensis TaxID=2486001 RepID=UPI000F7A932C|nr:site-specific integrase [Lapidilactobacillus wuchangensis]